MSWLYLPESVAASSARNIASAGERSATSSTNLMPSKSSKPAFGTNTSTTPPFGTMSEPSMGVPGLDWWMSSLRDSRASRSVQPEKCSPPKMSATAGRTPFASFEKSVQSAYSWKTSQRWLLGNTGTLKRYSETWPQAGMMLAGECYRRQKWERRILESASGLSLTPMNLRKIKLRPTQGEIIWPTPTARLGQNRGAQSKRFLNPKRSSDLDDAVAYYPTPTAIDTGSGRYNKSDSPNAAKRPTLAMMARKNLWPTPTTGDGRGRRTSKKAKEKFHSGPTLLEAIHGDRPGGKLNPDWVEWLMGWPVGWTDLKPLETDKFRQWRQGHSGS